MARMAKTLLVTAVFTSVLAAAAFAASTSAMTALTRRVYFILNDESGPYSSSMEKAAIAAQVHFPGLSIEVVNAHNSASEEISDINAALSAGAKGIIVDPVSQSVVVAARDAMNKGIPVFTVDRDLGDSSARIGFIGTDQEKVGRLETQYAADYLNLHHIAKPWNVAILQGTMGAPESAGRLKGALDVLQPLVDKGTVKLVLNESANFSADAAQGMVRTWLTGHGTGSLQLVVCGNDMEARGAISAIMALATGLGTRTFVVGADASPQGLREVRDGVQLDTVSHSPYVEAYWSVEAMDAYLLHGTKPNAVTMPHGDISIPVTLVTRSNAQSVTDWGTPRVITALPYGPAASFRVSMK